MLPFTSTLALYVTYLPLPLVLLADADGVQSVHIAPEAFAVSKAEFKDDLDFWQQSLPGQLKGQLESVRVLQHAIDILLLVVKLSGAKVYEINYEDPFISVNVSAAISGSSQSFATRQNM